MSDLTRASNANLNVTGARGPAGPGGWTRLIDQIAKSSLRADIMAGETDVEVTDQVMDAVRTGKNVWIDEGLWIFRNVPIIGRQTISGAGRYTILQQPDNTSDPVLVYKDYTENNGTVPLGGKFSDFTVQAGNRTSFATGAKTDAAGYAIGVNAINLAATGAGDLIAGDTFKIAGDTTTYTVRGDVANVNLGGALTFVPKLKVAIGVGVQKSVTGQTSKRTGFGILSYSSRTRFYGLDLLGVGLCFADKTANGNAATAGNDGGQHVVDCRFVGCRDGAIYGQLGGVTDWMMTLSTITGSGYTDGTEAGTRAAIDCQTLAGVHIFGNKMFNNPNRIINADGSASLIIFGNKIDAGMSQPLLAEDNRVFDIKVSDYQDGRPQIYGNNWRLDFQNVDEGSGVYRAVRFGNSDGNNFSINSNTFWLDPTLDTSGLDIKVTEVANLAGSDGQCVGNDYSSAITQTMKGDAENAFGLDAPRVYAAAPFEMSAFTAPYVSRGVKSGLKGPGLVRAGLIDDLLDALGGEWLDTLDIFYLIAMTSEGFGLFNIAAPGVYTAINHGGVFTTDRGIAGNGASAWIDTGAIGFKVPKMALGDQTSLAWSGSDLSAASSNLYGQLTGSKSRCNPRSTSNAMSVQSQNNTAFATANGSVTNSIGSFGALRPDATQFYAVGRGAIVGTCSGADPAAAASAVGTDVFTLLRDQNNYSARTIQAFMLGSYNDPTAYAAADAAMTDYLDAIGAPHA